MNVRLNRGKAKKTCHHTDITQISSCKINKPTISNHRKKSQNNKRVNKAAWWWEEKMPLNI